MSVSSESTVGEADPPPAQDPAAAAVEVDADAAPAPEQSTPASSEPAACACPSVVVHCRGGGSMYANTDRGACTFAFPPAMCAVLGLEDGSSIDPETLLTAAPQKRLSADDVYDFCAGKHEASHACDAWTVSSCASEGRAYGVTVACMRELLPAVCEDASDCHRLGVYIEASEAARDVNECLCTGDTCAACAASCSAAHPGASSTCDRAAAAYCASP